MFYYKVYLINSVLVSRKYRGRVCHNKVKFELNLRHIVRKSHIKTTRLEVNSLNTINQGSNEDVLKIVGRAVLTLHVHGEALSADKVVSMIECYAEKEPVNIETQRLYALAIEMMSSELITSDIM